MGKDTTQGNTCLMCAVKVKKKRLEHHMAEKCPSKILWNRLDASTRAKLLAGVEESCQPKQAGLVKIRPSGFFWFFWGFCVFFVFFLYICPEERVFRVFSVSRILLGASRR
jgi:hypothetical protein